MTSRLRIALAGLTVAALVGGVMAASPAMAGKKKKKSHHSKVVKNVQKARGGDARTGDGGNGGKGGHGGSALNTGAGGGFVIAPGAAPGAGLPADFAACMAVAAAGDPDGAVITAEEFDDCLEAAGLVLADLPAAFLACVGAPPVNAIPPGQQFCLAGAPGFPAAVFAVPAAASIGGAGGSGAASGAAVGGAGGTIRNTDNSSRIRVTTVND